VAAPRGLTRRLRRVTVIRRRVGESGFRDEEPTMQLKPKRKTSKKQKALKKAPKAAAAVWAGKRSGKVVKGVAIAIVGVVTLRALRKRFSGGDEPAAADDSYRTSPTPASSQQSSPVSNGAAPAQEETAPHAQPAEESATPPHGDALTAEKPAAEEGESSSEQS